MDILCILLIAEHMQRQPQNRLVIASYQRVKGSPLPSLGLTDQLVVFDALLRPRFDLRLRQLAAISGTGLCGHFCHAWQ
jgi:hypothetical protein